MVDVNFVRRKEPHVHAVAAIWSPYTGIVEAEALIGALARLCRDHDVAMLVGTSVVGASSINGGIEIVTTHERFVADTVIRCPMLTARDSASISRARPGASNGIRRIRMSFKSQESNRRG